MVEDLPGEDVSGYAVPNQAPEGDGELDYTLKPEADLVDGLVVAVLEHRAVQLLHVGRRRHRDQRGVGRQDVGDGDVHLRYGVFWFIPAITFNEAIYILQETKEQNSGKMEIIKQYSIWSEKLGKGMFCIPALGFFPCKHKYLHVVTMNGPSL